MSESESSSKDVVIGISIGLVILGGLYAYLSLGESTSNMTERPTVAQDNADKTKTKPSSRSDEAPEDPSIRVRKTKDGVFVERIEPLKSDPAFYREQSIFERSPGDHLRAHASRGQAASRAAGGTSGSNTPNKDVTGQAIPDGDAPANNGERTGGNQAGGWY